MLLLRAGCAVSLVAGCWGEQGKAAQRSSSGKSAGERTSFSRDRSDPNRPTCSHQLANESRRQEATAAAAAATRGMSSSDERCAALRFGCARSVCLHLPPPSPPLSFKSQPAAVPCECGAAAVATDRPAASRIRVGAAAAASGQTAQRKGRKSGAHEPARPTQHRNTTNNSDRSHRSMMHDRAAKLLRDETGGMIDNFEAGGFWHSRPAAVALPLEQLRRALGACLNPPSFGREVRRPPRSCGAALRCAEEETLRRGRERSRSSWQQVSSSVVSMRTQQRRRLKSPSSVRARGWRNGA